MSAAPIATAGSLRTGLLDLARHWRARLTIIAVLVIAAAVVELIPALIVGHVIDHNLTPRRTDGLTTSALLYLGALSLVATLTGVYGYLAASVAQRSLAGLRTRLFAHLLQLPAAYHDTTPIGDSISRATADVEAIDDLFSSSAATLLAETARLLTVLIAMAALSLPLTGLALLVAPPLYLLTRYLRRKVRDAVRDTRTALATLNTQLHEDLTAVEVIRAFDREDVFANRFRTALTGWLRATNRGILFNAYYAPALGVMSATATALLLWAGGNGAFAAIDVSLGTLTAFVLLFAKFFSPLTNLGEEWQTVQAALAGAERVFAVLAIPTDTAGDRHATAGVSSADVVALSQINFGYTPDHPVLRDITLTVRPGEHVAIVGRTGAGKSSLISLLAGLYTPWTGHLTIAGRDPRALHETERRGVMGYVPQQVTLFSGTILDNLTLGDDTIPAADIHHAAKIANANRVIDTLPDGYHTVLSDTGRGSGVQLSAGQRQLLALARALATRPTVLLLDEATGVVDGASDAAFRAALHDHVLPSGTAVITIAHRLSTARDADRVFVMADGRIIEEGPPADLITSDTTFAALSALEDAGWDWQNAAD
jgi:ATP-binding cassette subfamily B protein